MSQVSEQFDYSKKIVSAPKYSFSKLLPQSGSQSVSVLTSGGSEAVFEIPVGVYNLSESYLTFTIAAAQDLNTKYSYAYLNALTPISQIQAMTRGGVYLADINNVQNFTNLTVPVLTELNEFLTFPTGYNAVGMHQMFQPSNQLRTATAVSVMAIRPENADASKSYTEMKYIENSAVGNNAAQGDIVWTVKIPLSLIKHSIFSLDKDLPFKEIINLRIVFGSSAKVYFTGDSQTNPSSAPVAATEACPITNLTLFAAKQENEAISNGLMNQARSKEGMSILMDWVWGNKTSISTSTSHSVTVKPSRAQGQRLKRIYHAVYDNTESANTAYDHNQYGDDKVKEYYTILNNNREQPFNIDTSNYDDYMIHAQKLKGSCLSDQNIFQYNGMHISDFCNSAKPLWLQEKEDQNVIQGLSLDQDITWSYFASSTTSAAYQDYTFVITQRELILNDQGIFVM